MFDWEAVTTSYGVDGSVCHGVSFIKDHKSLGV